MLFCVCHLPPAAEGGCVSVARGCLENLGVVYLRCLPVGVGFLEAGELCEFIVTRDINARGRLKSLYRKKERGIKGKRIFIVELFELKRRKEKKKRGRDRKESVECKILVVKLNHEVISRRGVFSKKL